jgi:hypothetical protein
MGVFALSRVTTTTPFALTAVGYVLFGAIGVTAAVSDWKAKAGRFPAPIRAMAPGQAQNVGGARIGAVTETLGPAYRHPAVQSFVHGYHLAVGVAAACLLAATVVAVVGFGRPSSPIVQASGSWSPTQSRAQKVSE